MNKGISVALLIIGVLLIVWGVSAFDSASSDVSQALTGSPTNKAIWLLVGALLQVWSGYLVCCVQER